MVGRDGSTFVPLAFVECDESDTQVGPGVHTQGSGLSTEFAAPGDEGEEGYNLRA